MSKNYLWIAAAALLGCANQQDSTQTTPPDQAGASETEATEADVAVTETTMVAVDEQGRAVGGYDVVAYHTEEKAVPGDEQYAVEHGGATYLFASEENKTAFEAEPDKYKPAYGGYCAFGVAQNKQLPANPESFTLQDGKLYMFFKGNVGGKDIDTKPAWDADPTTMTPQADANWEAGELQPPELPAPTGGEAAAEPAAE